MSLWIAIVFVNIVYTVPDTRRCVRVDGTPVVSLQYLVLPVLDGLPNYRRLPQTTADYHRLPQTNVHVHRRPKKIAGNVQLTTFTQIRNTANYRRLIFHYRRPILMCGKATCETDGKLPQTTFYLPQTNYT